jgi:rhodanese-related sulfurtransferase
MSRITASQAMTMVNEQGAQLIDVRNPQEFLNGAVPGAINIPVGQLVQTGAAQLDKNKPVIAYCLSGGRSEQAVMILNAVGFKQTYNAGGINDFASA